MFMIDVGVPSHYALLGVSPTASVAEIRSARDEKVNQLRLDARAASAPEREAELTAAAQSINAAGEELARPALREKYDREHPELRLFTRRSVAAPVFIDPRQRVGVLYRAILAYFADQGASSAPASDLFRTDFATDESPNPLLDMLIAQRRH